MSIFLLLGVQCPLHYNCRLLADGVTQRTLSVGDAASYTYAANNGNLTKMTYGNGQYVTYTYDIFDRLRRTDYNSGTYIAYEYNAEGSLARMSYGTGNAVTASYSFEYDSLGRLIRSRETDGSGNTVQRTEHLYDKANRLSSQSWVIGTTSFSESYTYNTGDGSLKSMKTAAGSSIHLAYDTLKRFDSANVKNAAGTSLYTVASSYYAGAAANQTKAQVEEFNTWNSNNTAMIAGSKYVYDALGNITVIYESQIATGNTWRRRLADYTYDKQNQLTQEVYYTYTGTSTTVSSTETYAYTYDSAGNILTKSKNGTVVLTYTYGDSNWNDLLTKVNGYNISYDAIGNPTAYKTGSSPGYSMWWSNGRQLMDLEYTALDHTEIELRMKYDADGIRTQKRVVEGANTWTTTTAHDYVTQNGKVVRETINDGSTVKVLDFIYDESGRPFALNYSTNGGSTFTTYYYVLNLQGDVVALTNSSGTVLARYTYTAWGEPLSITTNTGVAITNQSNISHINPLRYRGYYYDTETGFYYLQSRYYDPAIGRFINADGYASTGQGFTGNNMFAYCNNNPVCLSDSSGNAPCTMMSDGGGGGKTYRKWLRYTARMKKEMAAKVNYNAFLNAMGFRESSDSYSVVNGAGFMGRYQMGESALIDAGFLDRDGNWTSKANGYGVYSKDDFLNTPAAQDAAIAAYHAKVCGYIRYYGMDVYIGTHYDGALVTKSGLLAASHLVGAFDLSGAMKAGVPVTDGNGVKASEYMNTFAGYNISVVWDS